MIKNDGQFLIWVFTFVGLYIIIDMLWLCFDDKQISTIFALTSGNHSSAHRVNT